MGDTVQSADEALIDGAYAAAVKLYDEAEDRYGTCARIVGHRGCAYWAIGRKNEALEEFRQAAALDPDNLRWQYRIALHELISGKPEKMREIADSDHAWLRDMAKEALKSSNVKFDWYQTDEMVVITLHCRNVAICQPSIEDGTKLTCNLTIDGEHSVFSLELASAVKNPVVKLFQPKVEIQLEKVTLGKWPDLVKPEEKAAAPKPKAKNWDAILSEMDVDSKDEELGVDDFFKKIYSSGSEEVRKAMVKSFQESGGTVLSTNWKEVSKGKVDVQPPEGMEFRKWDE